MCVASFLSGIFGPQEYLVQYSTKHIFTSQLLLHSQVSYPSKFSIHLWSVTDDEHHHDPAEERRHGVVPPVGAGDGVVQIGVPWKEITQPSPILIFCSSNFCIKRIATFIHLTISNFFKIFQETDCRSIYSTITSGFLGIWCSWVLITKLPAEDSASDSFPTKCKYFNVKARHRLHLWILTLKNEYYN